jgi:hypothetical protein
VGVQTSAVIAVGFRIKIRGQRIGATLNWRTRGKHTECQCENEEMFHNQQETKKPKGSPWVFIEFEVFKESVERAATTEELRSQIGSLTKRLKGVSRIRIAINALGDLLNTVDGACASQIL